MFINIKKFNLKNSKHKKFVIDAERSFIETHGEETVWFYSDIKEIYGDDSFNVFIAEVHGYPAAYVMYNKYEDETTHLETIYTDNRFRKKGIMKKLLRESLKEMYDRYSLKEIHAENLIEDIRSDKSLFSAGFKVISIDSEMYEGEGGKRLLHKALS